MCFLPTHRSNVDGGMLFTVKALSVRNISAQAIDVANANLMIERVA